jgi:hypothetical protein
VSARLRRCLAIVLIFAVIGPPVGGLVVIYGSEVARLRTAADFMAVTRKFADAFALVAGMSYVLGTLPALTAGLLIGIRQAFYGAVTWTMALGIGLIVGGAFAIAVVMVARQSGEAHLFSAPSAVMVIACVVSTMVCWALVRLWYGFSWQDES